MHTSPLPRTRHARRRRPVPRWMYLAGTAAVMCGMLAAGLMFVYPDHQSTTATLDAGQGTFPTPPLLSDAPVPPASSTSAKPSTTATSARTTAARPAGTPRTATRVPVLVFTETVTVPASPTPDPPTSTPADAATSSSEEPGL